MDLRVSEKYKCNKYLLKTDPLSLLLDLGSEISYAK
jgi:hypothetical protein